MRCRGPRKNFGFGSCDASMTDSAPSAPPPVPSKPARFAVSKRVFRLLGPILLIVLIVRLPHRDRILHDISHVAWLPLLGAMALNFLTIHLKVVRWDALLRTRGIRYPLRRLWTAFSASLYLGLFTPGRLGDVLRIHYLRRDSQVPYAEGLATVVMDRICDLYVLSVFAALGIVRFHSVIVGDIAYLAWSSLAASILAPLLVLVPGVAERAMRTISSRFGISRDTKDITLFLDSLRTQARASWGRILLLTIAAFLASSAQGWLVARAMGIHLDYDVVICLLALATLAGLLPITMSGIGLREALFLLIFPFLGYAAEQGVTFGLLVFVVIYIALGLIGFVSWQLSPPSSRPSVSSTP